MVQLVPLPPQNPRLCDLLSDGWHEQPPNEVVEALAPNTRVQFLSLPHHSTSLHNNLSICLRFVQLQSNFRKLLTGYLADVADGDCFTVIRLSDFF